MVGCKVIGMALHYLFLCVICWMGLECLVLYMKLLLLSVVVVVVVVVVVTSPHCQCVLKVGCKVIAMALQYLAGWDWNAWWST